jgi:hypothetical protein
MYGVIRLEALENQLNQVNPHVVCVTAYILEAKSTAVNMKIRKY